MKIDLTQKKAIIFDFDGTLVDIEPIFIEIFNSLASDFKFAPLLPADVAQLKKIGAREFLRTRVALPFWKIWKLKKRGEEEYRNRMERIELFSGMKELTEDLRNEGYRIGIISSNASGIISDLIKKFDMEIDFMAQSTIFGKARAIKKTLQNENLKIENIVYIGDELRDVEACQAIGADMIAVTWGLNEKESLVRTGAITADEPAEIFHLLSRVAV